MMEVVFLASVQGYQLNREKEVADRLKADRPDLVVRLVPPEASQALLAKYKLKFGPAILMDNRLEFVGVPRYRMLLERVEISKRRAQTPPATSSPPPPKPLAPPNASRGSTSPSAPAKPADPSG